MNKLSCGTCFFYNEIHDNVEPGKVMCCMYKPPVPVIFERKVHSMLPRVEKDHYCAEHTMLLPNGVTPIKEETT